MSGGLPSWLGFCVVTSQPGEARATWQLLGLGSAGVGLSRFESEHGRPLASELGQVTIFLILGFLIC